MEKRDGQGTTARLTTYFRQEWFPLLMVTATGILYNAGMTAGPWFEGQLAQTLLTVMEGQGTARDMAQLAGWYLAVIALVQLARYGKRFYVRRFASDVSRRMKRTLYRSLVRKDPGEAEREGAGSLMTKAVADVDACAEGMRKFTTEVFDTGVVMVAYLALLLSYDWRLALLSCAIPPVVFLLADRLKQVVTRSVADYRESAGRLSGETLDRVAGALTYRVLGEEARRDAAYEARLCDYEKRAVRAETLETALQPLYQAVAMLGTVLIVFFGARNVAGTGWTAWDVAAFTTFLSCFAKLSLKASKAGKLFNAVQKARVSWGRIKPLLQELPALKDVQAQAPAKLTAQGLSFAYPGGSPVLAGVSFSLRPGEIAGVTGPVACGKSTLLRAFLCETPYGGHLRLGGRELRELTAAQRCGALAYQGHAPELLSDTIWENVALGDAVDVAPYLAAACLTKEVAAMPEGAQTKVGNGGVRLSGGQQARLAFARTLCHARPVLLLDDPFAALDQRTETQAFANLRDMAKDSAVLLCSHRLYFFPALDKVLWVEDGHVTESTHAALMAENAAYRALYLAQTGGGAE